MRSVPWDPASLRQEPAVCFFSIWQHQIQVLMQGSKQAWRCPPAAFGGTPRAERAPVAETSDSGTGGTRSSLGSPQEKRWVKDMNQLSTPLSRAPHFHRKLGKSELHNFAWSVPLKGQTAELTVRKGFLSCSSAICILASLGVSACERNCCLSK